MAFQLLSTFGKAADKLEFKMVEEFWDSSEGFNTTVFPAANAAAIGRIARAIGKLNGEITRITPSGSL
jgi:hypothetical protein